MLDHRHYLQLARSLADYSDCQKMRIGAVIVDDLGRTLGAGFNRSVRPEICKQGCMRAEVKSGTMQERCYAIHAEQAAAIQAVANYGFGPGRTCYINGFLVVTGNSFSAEGMTCTFCSRILKAAGVSHLTLPSPSGFPIVQTIEEAIDSAYKWALGE